MFPTRHSRSSLLLLILAALLAVTAVAPTSGQDHGLSDGDEKSTAVVDRGLESPRATMRSFFRAMGSGGAGADLERAVKCLDTRGLSDEAAAESAQELFEVLGRIETEGVDYMPDRNAVRGRSLTQYSIYPSMLLHGESDVYRAYPEGRIVLALEPDGAWRFDAETVAGIREFNRATSHLGGANGDGSLRAIIRNVMPDALTSTSAAGEHKFFTLEYYQWLLLAVLVMLGVILDHTVRVIILIVIRRALAKRDADAAEETRKRMVRPFGLFASAVLWFWGLQLLWLPVAAEGVLLIAVRLFLMLATVWAANRVTDLVAEVAAKRAIRTATRFDDVLIPLVRKAVKILIFVFGLIYIADSLRIEIAPLLAGLGIGGLAFAFAARDTIENFFGSITVIADRPFEVGDWVVINDTEGTVEELGFRSTRVRTFYNSLVTIPNATLVRAVVDNYGRRKYRRVKTHVGIQYDTPPDTIEAFCEGIRELIRVHPYTRKDYYQVWFHQFSASSLDILIYVFHEAPDWQTELRERHRLWLDILRLADRLGVKFAFPTQTLHLHQSDPGAEHLPAEAPSSTDERKSLLIGRRAVRDITREQPWQDEKPGPYVFRGRSHDDEDDDTQIESKVGGDA